MNKILVGEEYTNVLQINHKDYIEDGISVLPWRKKLLLIFETILPFLIKRFMEKPYDGIKNSYH